MKILVVTPGLSGGGAERVACILANALASYGHDVVVAPVYSDRPEYHLDSSLRVLSCVSGMSGIRGLIDRSNRIKHVLKVERPTVALSFVIPEMVYSETIFQPVVQTLRNDPWNEGASKAHKALRDLAFNKAAKVVFQTDGSIEYFTKPIRAKGTVLPNPLNVSCLPKWCGNTGSREFIAVARLEQQKNYPMLIEAFAFFSETHPGYTLSIYGEGSQRVELEALIGRLNMGGSVFLRGRSKQVHSCMASAACFVMSSDYEGVSNSMLEALCIGMPCVVTDHSPGGAREYINNGENGLLTKVGDSQDMARALARIVDEPGLAESLGARAALVRNMVDSETVCRQWERMLLEVAADGRL